MLCAWCLMNGTLKNVYRINVPTIIYDKACINKFKKTSQNFKIHGFIISFLQNTWYYYLFCYQLFTDSRLFLLRADRQSPLFSLRWWTQLAAFQRLRILKIPSTIMFGHSNIGWGHLISSQSETLKLSHCRNSSETYRLCRSKSPICYHFFFLLVSVQRSALYPCSIRPLHCMKLCSLFSRGPCMSVKKTFHSSPSYSPKFTC